MQRFGNIPLKHESEPCIQWADPCWNLPYINIRKYFLLFAFGHLVLFGKLSMEVLDNSLIVIQATRVSA
jgi:hypothetical protein